jgi:tRNA threonylcarbamoyl adenosine modification protein YeaZ
MMGQRLLVIDTSGAACSIALFDGGRLLDERHEVMGRGHAERIIPAIATLPDGGRADEIWVGCGPGSFTGLRVGIAAARALALGWGVPVFGFSSLALIAAGAACDGPILIATEGGHGELFIQPFDAASLAPLGVLQSLVPEMAAQASSIAHVAGTGAARLCAARGSGDVMGESDPQASHALRLPRAALSDSVSPIYGRAPDAKPAAVR